MKLIQIHYHFEYTEAIEAILDQQDIGNFVRYAMVEGRDRDGKHFGSKIFPGSGSVVQAQVPDDKVDGLLDDLARFREAETSHRHLTALVLPVEKRL